jgi:hypothetical protein
MFRRNRIEFDLLYYSKPEQDSADTPHITDFAFVQVIRLTDDRYGDGSIIKVARKRKWYRTGPGGVEEIDPVTDHPTTLDLESWNRESLIEAFDLGASDQLLGERWHASPEEDGVGTNSWDFRRLMRLGNTVVPQGKRLIIQNLLLRFAWDGQRPVRVPFDAQLYRNTDELILHYYFGTDPILRTVRFCKEAC